MKGIFLIIVLLVLFSALYANAVLSNSLVSEVWFTADGHLMVEFYTIGEEFNLNTLSIQHGEYQETIPDTTLVSHNNPPVVVDITELLPDMVFSPLEDSLVVIQNIHDWLSEVDKVKWGNDINDDIVNLQPGQSMVHYGFWVENYWGIASFNWVKDESPTPETNPFNSIARSVLKLKVIDQNNDPVPNVSCDCEGGTSSGITDMNGEVILPVLSCKIRPALYHPITNGYMRDHYYCIEPYDTLEATTQINMPAVYPYTKYKGLQAYPMPYNNKIADLITFRYYGETELKGICYIKIYDSKGRYITKQPMSAKGFTTFGPSSDFKSGTYIAQLISGNRIVDTTKITVIK